MIGMNCDLIKPGLSLDDAIYSTGGEYHCVGSGLNFCCFEKDWPRQDSLDGGQSGQEHNEEKRYWHVLN